MNVPACVKVGTFAVIYRESVYSLGKVQREAAMAAMASGVIPCCASTSEAL